jgi:hypothetical protein
MIFRAITATVTQLVKRLATGSTAVVSDVRFEVFMAAVTMKNAVFWDIKTQFVPHRRHIPSTL